MEISCKTNTTYGVRSISVPMASHPTTSRIEKELKDINTWVLPSWSSSCTPSTEAVCNGLLKLSTVYERMQELLNSLNIQNEKWFEELMDGLVEFMDVCGVVREIVSELKGHVIVLQCALRRRKGELTLVSTIVEYNHLRKRIKKDVKQLIAGLKQSMAAKLKEHHRHHHDEVVIKKVKEVKEVTFNIFNSMLLKLLVMADSRTPSSNKWSIVLSKLIQKTKVTCEEQQQAQHGRTIYDFRGLDVSSPKCQLETMEAQLDRIEDSLETIFRRLIRTRASLLNIVSHY